MGTLSITDGAPKTVDMGGVRARIPGALDYRIVARVEETLGADFDAIDGAILMLYCCLHTTRKQIAALWQQARNPPKLAETVVTWQAGQEAGPLGEALNALTGYLNELEDEQAVDADGPDNGKKKTGAASTSSSE